MTPLAGRHRCYAAPSRNSTRPQRSRVYICGLGYHELSINGKKVGDHHLDPAPTRYDKRALYVTHDVTRCLRAGRNTIGVILGHGWHNVQSRAVWNFHDAPWRAAPKLLLKLRRVDDEGRVTDIVSDESWKCSRFVRMVDGAALYEVGSGSYTFASTHARVQFSTTGNFEKYTNDGAHSFLTS